MALTPTRAQTLHPTATPAPPTAILTHDTLPRWKQYESALAKAILPKEYRGLCEWEILGRQKNEVYVWAICASSPAGAKGSVPAVIILGDDGNIQEVKIPGDGMDYSRDIRKLFPPEIQGKVFDFHSHLATEESFEKRFTDRTLPPQIVISGTPLP